MPEELKPIDLSATQEAGTAFAPEAIAAGFTPMQFPSGATTFFRPPETAPLATNTSAPAEQQKEILEGEIQKAIDTTTPTIEGPDLTALKSSQQQQADLLTGRQTQLEARRKAETERINAEFQRLQEQQAQAQKQETGATSVKLARMGGFLGEGTAGMQYEVALEGAHRQEVRDLESKRQSALQQSQQAFEDGDFKLAQQMLDTARQSEQDIYARQQDYQEQQRKTKDQQMKEAQFEFDIEKDIADITQMFRGEPTYQAIQDDLKNALAISDKTWEFMGAPTAEAKKWIASQALDEAQFDLTAQKFMWDQQQDQIANDFKAQGIDIDYARLDLDTMKAQADAMGIKPPTQSQLTAFGYYTRANDAEKKIMVLEDTIASLGLFGQTNLRYAPNIIQNPEYQKYNQAKRQFVEAYLRKDSGAAIAASEYENADKTYFPQPGDSEEVLGAKKQARDSILKSLEVQSGNAIKAYSGDISAGTGDPIDQFIQDHPDRLEEIEKLVNEGYSNEDIISAIGG